MVWKISCLCCCGSGAESVCQRKCLSANKCCRGSSGLSMMDNHLFSDLLCSAPSKVSSLQTAFHNQFIPSGMQSMLHSPQRNDIKSIYHFAIHIKASLLPQEIDATQLLFVLSLCAGLPVQPVVDIKAQVLLSRVPPLPSEVDHRLSGLIHIQKQIIHFSKLTLYSSCPSPLRLSAADLSISVCAMTPSSTETLRCT